MRQRDEDDEEDELDDRELPDVADVDDETDDELDIVPCPYCGQAVSEHADLCPHCRNFVTHGAEPTTSARRVLTIVVVLCLILTLMWALFA